MTTIELLRSCFQRPDMDGLNDLYSDDAVLEIHVGAAHDVYRGKSAIIDRYTQDYAQPATFQRWDVRDTAWGAVVEAAAIQVDGEGGKSLFRWVQLLTIEGGRISADTVYCTGAVRVATDEAH